MKAIRAGTKASKFVSDAVYADGKYYIPSTIYRDEIGNIKMVACYYRRHRGDWTEDSFILQPDTANKIINFAKSKGLN